MELTSQELEILLQCCNVAVKASDQALQAGSVIIPIAAKLAAEKERLDKEPDKKESE